MSANTSDHHSSIKLNKHIRLHNVIRQTYFLMDFGMREKLRRDFLKIHARKARDGQYAKRFIQMYY